VLGSAYAVRLAVLPRSPEGPVWGSTKVGRYAHPDTRTHPQTRMDAWIEAPRQNWMLHVVMRRNPHGC